MRQWIAGRGSRPTNEGKGIREERVEDELLAVAQPPPLADPWKAQTEMSRALVTALILLIGCSSAHAGQMTYTPTTGGKPVTEKSVSIPLRVLGPLYQRAVKRCDATSDCDDEQALF
jgi:hypothetical protein